MILFDTVESGILLLSSLWGQQWKWTEFRQMGPEGMRQGKKRDKNGGGSIKASTRWRQDRNKEGVKRRKYVKFYKIKKGGGGRWVTIREKLREIKKASCFNGSTWWMVEQCLNPPPLFTSVMLELVCVRLFLQLSKNWKSHIHPFCQGLDNW